MHRLPAFRRLTALAWLGLAGCAGTLPAPGGPAADGALPWSGDPSVRAELERSDRAARLAVRASSMAGQGLAPFEVNGERFNPDCSGFVDAVYEAEGVPLRALQRLAAPRERSAVAALWTAVALYGRRLGGGEWPAPGDLVFFHDTWDRNGNAEADDPFTHVGVVETVDDRGTVTFLHRGGKGVARAVVTPSRPDDAADEAGQPLNSPLRAKGSKPAGAPGLSGQLLAGFGRIDPARAPAPEGSGGR